MIETLFILRNKQDAPLKAGDEIIAKGFRLYRITVKQVLSSKKLNNGIQFKIKATREAIIEK